MIARPFWLRRITDAWAHAPIVWLSGVRRSGKTVLAQALAPDVFLNCDLPSTRRQLADPEAFLASIQSGTIVFDEVHQLDNPSALLKIAADTRPNLRILATGSSTLAATAKFRDTLTGRKRAVHLTPVLFRELESFGVASIGRRMLGGGLPPALLGEPPGAGFFNEWLDSYYARDIQELFHVQKRGAFLLLVESLLRQSGGLMEITSLSRDCRLSRPTVGAYLEALDATHLIHVLRPFHGGATRELLRQPKVYGFDTGMVCHARGWDTLREEDHGLLWEHLVLDELLAHPAGLKVRFWRDKSQREIDFVVPLGRGRCTAIECKWSPDGFDAAHLRVFREAYPEGDNWVVTPHAPRYYERRSGKLTLRFGSPVHLLERIGAPR